MVFLHQFADIRAKFITPDAVTCRREMKSVARQFLAQLICPMTKETWIEIDKLHIVTLAVVTYETVDIANSIATPPQSFPLAETFVDG